MSRHDFDMLRHVFNSLQFGRLCMQRHRQVMLRHAAVWNLANAVVMPRHAETMLRHALSLSPFLALSAIFSLFFDPIARTSLTR